MAKGVGFQTRNSTLLPAPGSTASLPCSAPVAAGCGEEIQPFTPIILTTGLEVRLREMKPARSAGGQKAIYLKYQTELSADDLESLREEIQEIWLSFLRPQAERAQLRNALIVATTRQQKGWVASGYEFKMIYQKTPQGSWVRN